MPGYGDSWRSDLYTWDGRLTSFMRTVARRRDLAATVKRIYVHSLDPRAVFSFREFTVLKHLFLNLDEFHTSFWAGSLEEDPQLLIQLLSPSITSLYFAGHIRNELPRLEKALFGLADAVLSNEKLNAEHTVTSLFAAAGVGF
ncbi:hypothetical protein BDV12DRAFT_194769 [Aspergillus spectabilis]